MKFPGLLPLERGFSIPPARPRSAFSSVMFCLFSLSPLCFPHLLPLPLVTYAPLFPYVPHFTYALCLSPRLSSVLLDYSIE